MASASNVSVNQPLNLVLLGRTGNGKSSTGNSILGRKAFSSRGSLGSTTKECKMEHCTREDGRVVNVIDTPGVFDTKVPREDIEREIVKCINLAEGGIHAVIFVVSLTNKFTDEEEESIYMLQMLFGANIVNYMMIVFTGGDELETSLQDHLDQECPVDLKRTINLCNSRMVVFNNHKSASANVNETQITELLQQVDRIVANNEGRPYSNDLFLKAQERSSKSYHAKDKEKQYKEQYEKETMKKNALEMEKILQRLKAEYERDMESALCAHLAAASIIEKQKSEAKMKLREELLNQKKSGGSCIIM